MIAEGGVSDIDNFDYGSELSGEESDEEKSITKFLSPLKKFTPNQKKLMKMYYLSGIDRPKVLKADDNDGDKFRDENRTTEESMVLVKLDIFDEKYIIATCTCSTTDIFDLVS